MKYALISTIDTEKPYRFCETADVKFNVTEPALFWVECDDNITPYTHKYTDEGFVELPPRPPYVPPVIPQVGNTSKDTPTVL